MNSKVRLLLLVEVCGFCFLDDEEALNIPLDRKVNPRSHVEHDIAAARTFKYI